MRPIPCTRRGRRLRRCKARFSKLHHFYAQFCESCAAVNWKMRGLSADLTGKVALLTGARVKIGFEIGLKLRAPARRCWPDARPRTTHKSRLRARRRTSSSTRRASCTPWTCATRGASSGSARCSTRRCRSRWTSSSCAVPDCAQAGELLRAPASRGASLDARVFFTSSGGASARSCGKDLASA